MTLRNYFNKATFTKDDERVIRQILEAPETEQIIARAEQATIENRKVLRQRLDNLDARHDKGIAAAGTKLQTAIRALEAAEVTIMAAREEERQARAMVYAAEAAKGAEAIELLHALRDSRDMRLDDFWLHLDDAKDKLRHLTRITAFPLHSWTGGKSVRYETNADEVSTLSTALKDAQAEVEGMTLLPLTRAEVSERLTALTHKLVAMLDAFSLPTPRLDEDGAVTLSREKLKFSDVLQENRVNEPGDMRPAAPVTLAAPLPPTAKRTAAAPNPAPANKKPAAEKKVHYKGWSV